MRYVTCAGLVNALAEAADERRFGTGVGRYGRLDLLCLDELGYVQLDAKGAELLFQILTQREEKSSMATVSNLPFSEWGQVVGDPRLVAAIVDRSPSTPHHRDGHREPPPEFDQGQGGIVEAEAQRIRWRVALTAARSKASGSKSSPTHSTYSSCSSWRRSASASSIEE